MTSQRSTAAVAGTAAVISARSGQNNAGSLRLSPPQIQATHKPKPPTPTAPQPYDRNFAGLRDALPPWALADHVRSVLELQPAFPHLKLAVMLRSDPRLLLVSRGSCSAL